MWYQNVYVISLVSGALAAAITYFLLARRRKQQRSSDSSVATIDYYECGASFLVTGLLVFLGVQLHGMPALSSDGASWSGAGGGTATEALAGEGAVVHSSMFGGGGGGGGGGDGG
jgi:hypothetical protein